MNKKWAEKTAFEKTLDIVSFIALVVWLVLEFLSRKMTIEYIDIFTSASVGVICICQAISFWKVKRILSYVGLAGVACMIAVIILEMM